VRKLSIEFCRSWHYDPIAAGLAAELRREFGIEAELIPSSGGVFEVVVDGDVIYSKLATGRHAEPGEVARLLRERGW